MPSKPLILGFDTSAAYCAAVLLAGDSVLADSHEEMAKGQAERLMPLLQGLLDAGGAAWRDLSAIGVGTGPGNFTGIRISVAAAHGLSLSLGIPSVGVSSLDALAFGTSGPVLTSLDARRGQVYLKLHGRGYVADRGPMIADANALPSGLTVEGLICVGIGAADLAEQLEVVAKPACYAPASAIARIAALQFEQSPSRPVPLYLRSADAAPARAAPPVILP